VEGATAAPGAGRVLSRFSRPPRRAGSALAARVAREGAIERGLGAIADGLADRGRVLPALREQPRREFHAQAGQQLERAGARAARELAREGGAREVAALGQRGHGPVVLRFVEHGLERARQPRAGHETQHARELGPGVEAGAHRQREQRARELRHDGLRAGVLLLDLVRHQPHQALQPAVLGPLAEGDHQRIGQRVEQGAAAPARELELAAEDVGVGLRGARQVGLEVDQLALAQADRAHVLLRLSRLRPEPRGAQHVRLAVRQDHEAALLQRQQRAAGRQPQLAAPAHQDVEGRAPRADGLVRRGPVLAEQAAQVHAAARGQPGYEFAQGIHGVRRWSNFFSRIGIQNPSTQAYS